MQVAVDRARCTGHGRCYTLSPDVFAADDDGYSVIRCELPPPGLEDAARRGAANCPEDAITVVD
jgi:ferredoxin